MFKVTELGKKREINLFIDMETNLSLCRNSDHYFSQPLQQLPWDLLGTKNVSSTHAQNILEVEQIMAVEKMW